MMGGSLTGDEWTAIALSLRVAIGRAMLASPRMLLLDEPLASLDADRKLEVMPFIERLRDDFAIPIVYVSHAIEEVVRLAARIVALGEGRVTAFGTPAEILTPKLLAHSAERFEATSLISTQFKRYAAEFAVTFLAHPAGEVVMPGRLAPSGRPVRIAIRATNVSLSRQPPRDLSVRTVLAGRIERIAVDDGPFAVVVIELVGGDRLFAYVTRLAIAALALKAGEPVYALVKVVSIDERGVPGLQPTHHGDMSL